MFLYFFLNVGIVFVCDARPNKFLNFNFFLSFKIIFFFHVFIYFLKILRFSLARFVGPLNPRRVRTDLDGWVCTQRVCNSPNCTTRSMLKDSNIYSLFEGNVFFLFPKIRQSFVCIQNIPSYRLLSIYSINPLSQGPLIPDLISNLIIPHLIQSTLYIYIYATRKFNVNIVQHIIS